MNSKNTGRLFQDKAFEYKALNGLKIEQVIVCKEVQTKNVVLVYLKVENTNWHQYFLDAGIGFLESWEELDDMEDCKDFKYENITETLELQQQIISKIYAEPNENNSKIVIELQNQSQLILQCKDSNIFDSNCELIRVNV